MRIGAFFAAGIVAFIFELGWAAVGPAPFVAPDCPTYSGGCLTCANSWSCSQATCGGTCTYYTCASPNSPAAVPFNVLPSTYYYTTPACTSRLGSQVINQLPVPASALVSTPVNTIPASLNLNSWACVPHTITNPYGSYSYTYSACSPTCATGCYDSVTSTTCSNNFPVANCCFGPPPSPTYRPATGIMLCGNYWYISSWTWVYNSLTNTWTAYPNYSYQPPYCCS